MKELAGLDFWSSKGFVVVGMMFITSAEYLQKEFYAYLTKKYTIIIMIELIEVRNLFDQSNYQNM